MSDDIVYRKIAIDKICGFDVTFRKKNELYNNGKIILDIESFDFAGFLTGDAIVGYWRDSGLYVYYYQNVLELNFSPCDSFLPIASENFNEDSTLEAGEVAAFFSMLELEFRSKHLKPDNPPELVGKTISFDGLYSLTFNNLLKSMEDVYEVLNNSFSLIER